MISRASTLAVLVVSSVALAQQAESPPGNFDEYQDKYQFKCNGPLGSFDVPDVREYGGFRYEHTGATVKVRRATARQGPLRIGV